MMKMVHLWHPFASHKRFAYFACNQKQRNVLLSQSRVYLRQNASYASLTLSELKENGSVHLLNHVRIHSFFRKMLLLDRK